MSLRVISKEMIDQQVVTSAKLCFVIITFKQVSSNLRIFIFGVSVRGFWSFKKKNNYE